jgi:hypothetical protein
MSRAHTAVGSRCPASIESWPVAIGTPVAVGERHVVVSLHRFVLAPDPCDRRPVTSVRSTTPDDLLDPTVEEADPLALTAGVNGAACTGSPYNCKFPRDRGATG